MATPMMFGGLLGNESPLFASKPPKAAAPKPQTEDERLSAAYEAANRAAVGAQAAETEQDLKAKQAAALESRESIGRSKALMEQADRDTWAEPAFNPTKSQPMEIGKIFSMIATMGVMSGGGGKMGAMQAMNAMTGMLKGYQAGDQEAYERAKVEYDEGMKTIQAHNAQILKHLETALSLEATDREAAMVEKDLATRLAGQSSVIAANLNKGNTAGALEVIKGSIANAREVEKIKLQAQIAADREAAAYQRAVDVANIRLQGTAAHSGEQVKTLNEQLGTNFNATQAAQVNDSADAIAEASEMQDIVRKDPSIVGREGQVKQFVDRYINSAVTGTPAPADNELAASNDPEAQKALVFAKRYASYLIKYERSLVGGGNKNFTVNLQTRWNNLLSQNQFSAEGLHNVLEEQKRDVASNAAKLSPKITGNYLVNLGKDIKSRAAYGSTAQYTGSGTADDPIIIPE